MLWTLLAVGVIVGIGFVYLLTVPPPLERWLQARMLQALREHYRPMSNYRICGSP